MNLSRLAPRNVYSATSGPLPEIVTENVPDANLELVVRSEIRHRMEGVEELRQGTKLHGDLTFCLQNVHLGARRGPSVLLQLCLSQDTQKTISTAIFAFEIFNNPALSVLPKFTKRLIKIPTNKFSFPQVQVINGSQKPSKL